MNKYPQGLPTPVLFFISVSSIVLLLFVSLHVIAKKPSRAPENDVFAGREDLYIPSADVSQTATMSAEDILSEESKTRSRTQSDFDRMNLETQEQLQRLKIDRDLSKMQRSNL
jgi:hypothetical protein